MPAIPHTDGVELTTLEDIRRRVGLPRSRYAELLAIDTAMTTRKRGVPVEVVQRARNIAKRYAAYRAAVKWAVEREAERPYTVIDDVPYLSTRQVADALGIGEFHISNLRDRSALGSRKVGRVTVYAVEGVLALLDARDGNTHHSPLQASFLRYLDRHGASPEEEELEETSA